MCDRDIDGRVYATLSTLKPGDILEADGGFTCLKEGEVCEVKLDSKEAYENKSAAAGLYIECSAGEHFLCGQADDGEHCIGLYKLEKA